MNNFCFYELLVQQKNSQTFQNSLKLVQFILVIDTKSGKLVLLLFSSIKWEKVLHVLICSNQYKMTRDSS